MESPFVIASTLAPICPGPWIRSVGEVSKTPLYGRRESEMTGLVNILVILAVLALVVRRQFQVRKVDTERRLWLLPLILGALALRDLT